MSNASIASRILETIAAYEAGEIGASSIAASLELHEPALEAIACGVRERLHYLSIRVIEQDVTPHEEALLGISPSREALNELKSLVGLLR